MNRPSGTAARPGDARWAARVVEWQYSTDGGKTWVTAPATVQATTHIPGLTPGATVQFRYRTVTPKAGQGDWSQTVQLLIS